MTAAVLPALRTFFDHLRSVSWQPLLIVLGSQTCRWLARSRAWRNVLAAAYPKERVRWRTVFAAYVSGVGVNSVIPARSGDALKLFVVKRRVPTATYPSLASSLLADGVVDMILAACLIAWAVAAGVLPGVHVVRHLPSVDWFWLPRHPYIALALAVVLLALALLLLRRIIAFWGRVQQGLAILRQPGRWLRTVVVWQVLDWCLRGVTIFFCLRAFHIPATAGNTLRIQATQSLSTILPLTPSGIGTGQALAVYVLRGKATRTAIISFSVGMQLVLTIWSALVGFTVLLLTLRSVHWRRVVARDEAVPADADHHPSIDAP
jgi:uncharacterized membrane protein YbhN (UPF0104 family)